MDRNEHETQFIFGGVVMAFFEFPHTRIYDSDLGWLIHAFNEISEKLDTYLENAVIKFADPITWDITEQYTALTCVVDSDGTAYLSKQPVPAGIDISNTDYWLPIFNYDDNINELRDTIALNERTSATATQAIPKGSLIYSNGSLYIALVDIAAGSAFIDGTNIQLYTVDQKIDDIYTGLSQDITDLDTTLTGEINNIHTDINNLALAIPAYNVLSMGLKNDGMTDNYALFQSILDTNQQKVYYFPAGVYLFSHTLILPSDVHMFGDGADSYIYGTTDGGVYGSTLLVAGNNVEVDHLRIGFAGDDAALIIGSNPGDAGTTSHTYASAKSIDSANPLNIRENRSNVFFHHIYSTSTYVLQSEPSGNYTFTDIRYQSITAPKGMISLEASFGYLDSVIIDDVFCDFLRLYAADALHTSNILISNVTTCMLLAGCGNVSFDNISVICRSDSTVYTSAIYFEACRLARGNYNVNNLYIDSGNLPALTSGLLIYDSGYYNISNCISKNNLTANAVINTNNNVRLNNCDFRGTAGNILYGFADNIATDAGSTTVLKNNGDVTYTSPNPYYTMGQVSVTAQGQTLHAVGTSTKSSAILDDDLLIRPLNFYKATADTYGTAVVIDASNNKSIVLCKVLKGSSDIRIFDIYNTLAGGYSKVIFDISYPYLFQS